MVVVLAETTTTFEEDTREKKKKKKKKRDNDTTNVNASSLIFERLEVFFEAVAFLHVRFARVRFILELFFVFETNFFLLHDGEFDLIRRAHLLCILKRHHTYDGVQSSFVHIP